MILFRFCEQISQLCANICVSHSTPPSETDALNPAQARPGTGTLYTITGFLLHRILSRCLRTLHHESSPNYVMVYLLRQKYWINWRFTMRRFSAFVVIFTAVMGFTLFGVSLVKAGARQLRTDPARPAAPNRRTRRMAAGEGGAFDAPGLPSIKVSHLISIPFGFGSPLPILDQGQSVL